jgi:hypothetical protein
MFHLSLTRDWRDQIPLSERAAIAGRVDLTPDNPRAQASVLGVSGKFMKVT